MWVSFGESLYITRSYDLFFCYFIDKFLLLVVHNNLITWIQFIQKCKYFVVVTFYPRVVRWMSEDKCISISWDILTSTRGIFFPIFGIIIRFSYGVTLKSTFMGAGATSNFIGLIRRSGSISTPRDSSFSLISWAFCCMSSSFSHAFCIAWPACTVVRVLMFAFSSAPKREACDWESFSGDSIDPTIWE